MRKMKLSERMNEMNLIKIIKELHTHEILFETTPWGLRQKTIYVVTSEEYEQENEAFMGYLLGEHGFTSYPVHFGFDGHLYPTKTTEENIITVIGKARLNEHKKMMNAIVTIMGHSEEMDMITYDESPEHDCARCGISCREPDMCYDEEMEEWICSACLGEEIHDDPYAFTEINDDRGHYPHDY